MVTYEKVQLEIQRRQQLRFHLSTNDGSVELSGTDQVNGYEPDGMPSFLTRVTITAPGCHGQWHLNDRLLVHLVDLIEKFLQRPPAPVNVRVELVAPPAPQADQHEQTEPLDEVGQIRKRMLEGR